MRAPVAPVLTTYFDSVEDKIEHIITLPVDGIHLDLMRTLQQLPLWLNQLPGHWALSAGVIDGRNIWRADLDKVLKQLMPLHQLLGERLWIASLCLLLHVPVSLDAEMEASKLDGKCVRFGGRGLKNRD